MVISFMLVYTNADGRMIKDHRLIAHRYLTTYFPIDFVTILPFDSIKYMVPDSSGSETETKTLRIVRLMRLWKLLRILRASRLYERWGTRLGISHSVARICKLTCTLVFANIWLACLWGLLPFLQDEQTHTWLTAWWVFR